MSAPGRTSPSLLSRPQSSKLTARQRHSAIGDDDLRPLNRKTGSGGFLGNVKKAGKPPQPRGQAPVPRARHSPTLSPSILGATEQVAMDDDDDDNPFALPPNATGDTSAEPARGGPSSSRGQQANRVPTPPFVPDAPPPSSTANSLLSEIPHVGADEAYGLDEKQLNEMIRLHPMLSMEATSRQTLQLVAGMFEKASVHVANVPIIPFSYDASYLRPPNTRIGERQCACGDKCICLFLARWRHGSDTPLAFIGTEFLLPAEREQFLAGSGLPPRRKKCLVCTRYLQNLIYIQCRTDPNFKVTGGALDMQVFGNVVASPPHNENSPPDLTELGRTMAEMPMSASSVHARDGYKPEAMLFVDEEFATTSRASREGASAALMWKPVVR
jgi:hypothetical protein